MGRREAESVLELLTDTPVYTHRLRVRVRGFGFVVRIEGLGVGL